MVLNTGQKLSSCQKLLMSSPIRSTKSLGLESCYYIFVPKWNSSVGPANQETSPALTSGFWDSSAGWNWFLQISGLWKPGLIITNLGPDIESLRLDGKKSPTIKSSSGRGGKSESLGEGISYLLQRQAFSRWEPLLCLAIFTPFHWYTRAGLIVHFTDEELSASVIRIKSSYEVAEAPQMLRLHFL